MRDLEWEPKLHARYRQSLEKYLIPYEKRYSNKRPSPYGIVSATQVSDLEIRDAYLKSQGNSVPNECS